jgi:vancomycin resistance protein VanW
MIKPIQRSKIRLLAGRLFYTIKKHIYWYFLNIPFAKIIDSNLPIEVFGHQTILRRKLRDVEDRLQENKIINLKIAIEKLDGMVIEPGQVFSFWKMVGKPTRRKGYLDGMILHDGKVTAGVGGGLCQISNLIYWITLHTPLSVTERWRHGYDVFPDVKRDQPFGSGATCAYPNIDLQIKNGTDQKFQLKLEVTDEYLVGKWLSDKDVDVDYDVFEKDSEIKQELFGNYSRNNKIYRKIIDKITRKKVNEEYITENHALMMYNPLLESALLDKS